MHSATTVVIAPAPVQPVAAAAAVSPVAAAAPGEAPAEAIFGDDRVRVVLIGLLAELRRDRELAAAIEALELRLAESLTREQLPAVLTEAANLVCRRITNIESAKREIGGL